MSTLRQKRAEAGARGGRATLDRHGVEHMRRIGRAGARAFHEKYRLEPVLQNDFAIVHRITGNVVGFLNGIPTRR